MTWKARVDPTTCIASGICAAIAPEFFTLDGLHATVKAEDVEPDELLLDTADSCPTGAISVLDHGVEIGPRP
ncbi:MAG TPA: ferredoxin [Kineosporiaceae bacterium]|nr:ferredoxin [Kineosporiaceae bacterium]